MAWNIVIGGDNAGFDHKEELKKTLEADRALLFCGTGLGVAIAASAGNPRRDRRRPLLGPTLEFSPTTRRRCAWVSA